MCFSPRLLKNKYLRELDNPKCTIPIINAPHRTSALDTESELLTFDDFGQPLGNVSLGLSDEHGNQVDLNCHVNEPTKSTRMNWNHVNSFQINANITLTLDLECPIDRGTYEKLWRLVAYYSDVPAHLKREIMLSKDPHLSYRYRQDAEIDAVYFTGMKAIMVAEPAWIMQSAVNLQLNRPQSTSKKVKLILSTQLTQLVEAEEERQQTRRWVFIESKNSTKISQVVVVGNPTQMRCNVHSSGNPLIKWMLPNGSKVQAPYQSSDNRITVSPSGLLAITAVDLLDSGVYYCIAIVVGDLSILPFRLTVEDTSTPAPGSEGVSKPIAGVTGGPVSIPCVTMGSPDPDINWILPDNTIINTSSNLSRIFVAPNGTLTIRNSQLSDNGYYKCVAETQHGVDSLATKVTLTRPSGGHPIRKYPSRPQPAEGVSTKIRAPINNDAEASGDNENEGPEAKAFERVDTSYKRRITNVPVRSGHPTRKVWKRPHPPRRRITSDRSNSPEMRRKINVSNGQIDPEHWASILAKVRNGGGGDHAKPSTTVSSVLTSTNKLHQSDNAITEQSGTFKRNDGSIQDTSPTRETPQEASNTVTASGTPMQTTEVSLDIKPLDAKDQIHITYQITASEVNQDSDLIDIAYTTNGPQPVTHSVIDANIAKWDEVRTVVSTTRYETLFHQNQSHTLGEIEVFQKESDRSPISSTSMIFEENNTKNDYSTHLTTDIAKTALPENHDNSQITLLTTMAPTSQSTLEHERVTHTTSINLHPLSHARPSSNLRRKNNGRRRKFNRNRTKPKLSKSEFLLNITPKPNILAMVSEITKMTPTSESKIATSAGGLVIAAKVDSTVTDNQATSLSETSQEKRTDHLVDMRKAISSITSVSKKVSEAGHTPLPYAHNLFLSTTVLSMSTSPSLDFTGQIPIHRGTTSTLSPLIQNTQFTDHGTIIHLDPQMGMHYKETQIESTTGHSSSVVKSDPSPKTPQETQSEEIPGAALDKAENQYKRSENEFMSPSRRLVKEFTLKPFSSSAEKTQHEINASHDSEIPSGSTKPNIYEGTSESSQVTTRRPITSQNTQRSGMATTAKLNNAMSSEKQETATGRRAKTPEESTAPLMEDFNPVTTLKTTTAITVSTATTPSPKTLSATATPVKTTKRWRPSIWVRSGISDSPNHIPDRHTERILNPEQSIRSSSSKRPTVFHSTILSGHSKPDLSVLRTKKPQTTLKVSTTTPELLVPPSRQTLPAKPNGSISFIHHHYQQKPVIPDKRGWPKITSINISTVTVQAESDAHLPCVAVGEPRLFLSWTKISTGM